MFSIIIIRLMVIMIFIFLAKDNIRRKSIPALASLPGTPDSMLTTGEMREEKRAALERYLNSLLNNNFYREHSDVVSTTHTLYFIAGWGMQIL